MAIPFTIPNQEVSQPNIQELLRELCEILQQLLIICRQCPTAPNQQQIRNIASTTNMMMANQDRIPELMTNLSLLSAAFSGANHEVSSTAQNLRERIRRYRTNSESSCCDDGKNAPTPITTTEDNQNPQWIEVGMELRKIADDLKTNGYEDDENDEDSPEESSTKTSSSTKGDSIFSKLVPAPFTGSICTAVICVVGWHLLRNR